MASFLRAHVDSMPDLHTIFPRVPVNVHLAAGHERVDALASRRQYPATVVPLDRYGDLGAGLVTQKP